MQSESPNWGAGEGEHRSGAVATGQPGASKWSFPFHKARVWRCDLMPAQEDSALSLSPDVDYPHRPSVVHTGIRVSARWPERFEPYLHGTSSQGRHDGSSRAAWGTTGHHEGELIFGGFWARAVELLQRDLPDLAPYPHLPEAMRFRDCQTKTPNGTAVVRAEAFAYQVPGLLRQVRSALLSTNATSPKVVPPALSAHNLPHRCSKGGRWLTPLAALDQVLNFVIFPDLQYDLPIFGADLVTLPGGHLVVLDFQPVFTTPEYYSRYCSELRAIYEKYSPRVPAGGAIPEAAQRFFSPFCLFCRYATEFQLSQRTSDGPVTSRDRPGCLGRPTDKQVETDVFEAFEECLQAYLSLVRSARKVPEAEREGVKDFHLKYSQYRAKNDPARGMLRRMYGEEWTEAYIHTFLFDLEERIRLGEL
jgi:phycoerythrobilin:ferredoxin oxidoreductase